jgi:hypothetical protein
MSLSTSKTATPLVEARPLTLRDHIANIFRLVIKEL